MTSTNQSTRFTRAFVRFQNNPSSIRYASAAIIATIVVLVVLGALMMQLLASDQYDTFGEALWFTLQTVTTVGYGDNTPTSGEGRVVAAVVMLVSIGLVAVITAVVTSMFIRSVSRDDQESDRRVLAEALARIEAKLTEADERLAHIERTTAAYSDGSASEGTTEPR
jgi:voltage-gated potassium channel